MVSDNTLLDVDPRDRIVEQLRWENAQLRKTNAALGERLARELTEAQTLRAKAALLGHYCGWVRWRTNNGAVDADEIALADDLDAIDAGREPQVHLHWVRDAADVQRTYDALTNPGEQEPRP